MSDHVHTQACVVICRRYPGTTEAKDPAPATIPWDQRECPHGYGFDTCTQCHDAFHAGRESMTPATKMSFEERAEYWLGTPWTTFDEQVAELASAFAEVAEEAKREAIEHLAHMVPVEPAPDSFFGIPRGGIPRTPEMGSDQTIREAITNAVVELHAACEPICTCGAASVGSRLHSEWCECA